MEQQREHAVASLKANTEIQKLDISLTHLRQSFDQFRLQLVRTYDSIMTRLTRPDVEPLTAAERLYDETQKSAMQGYFRLSDDGDTLVADAQQLLGTLSSISKQMSLMDATISQFSGTMFEIAATDAEPGMPYIDLDQIF